MRRRTVLQAAAAAAAPVRAARAAADWPDRPVRVVVPNAPGTEGLMRLVAAQVAAQTGWNIVVEPRPGGNGVIGAAHVAHARPDGYTLLLTGVTPSSAAGSLYQRLPYDPLASFAPVCGIATNGYVLAVHPGVPARSVAELIALARSAPGQLGCGTANQSSRMAAELFKRMAGVDLLHVPYQAVGTALLDLAQGRLQLMFNGSMTTQPFARDGRVRVLGVSTAEPDAAYPGTPSIADTVPGYHYFAWQSLVAPAGTPASVLQRLTAAFTAALAEPALQARMTAIGMRPWPAPPQEAARTAHEDLARWRDLVREARIPITNY